MSTLKDLIEAMNTEMKVGGAKKKSVRRGGTTVSGAVMGVATPLALLAAKEGMEADSKRRRAPPMKKGGSSCGAHATTSGGAKKTVKRGGTTVGAAAKGFVAPLTMLAVKEGMEAESRRKRQAAMKKGGSSCGAHTTTSGGAKKTVKRGGTTVGAAAKGFVAPLAMLAVKEGMDADSKRKGGSSCGAMTAAGGAKKRVTKRI